MRVSYNWLKEYVDPGISPRELAERLALAGIEVESVEPFRPDLPGVVVGLITAIEPHPGSEKLLVARVNPGGQEVSIVCGARNIAVGQKVPLALPGSELPGRGRITQAAILGVASSGMLCSAEELGLALGPSEEGILILDPYAVTGNPVDRFLDYGDYILTLALTPNRADCLGMLGVAYEVAALTGARVKLPPAHPPQSETDINEVARVTVLDPDLCPHYTARVINNVKTAAAPLWMQLRLIKAGIRPINVIVDITNYVMLEYGQPLHAFDYDLLWNGEIIVRRGRPGETLVTLDGLERSLDSNVLVIAGAAGPVGLAGVMGGENTEIGPSTRRVLLEAARFNPSVIRRTARRFNLPSEASQRFERGVNPEWVSTAQNRAALLMAELGGGEVLRGMIDVVASPARPRLISVRPHRINEILGVKIPVEEVASILERLDFTVERGSGRTLAVTVPPRRGDISLEEDVVEEVARLFGYENIPVTLPRGEMVENREAPDQLIEALARQTLTACGFFEAITYAFINPAQLEKLGLPSDDPGRAAIPLQNPLSEEHSVMRTTLLPGLLKVIQHNFNYREMNQLFFEIGAVYFSRRLPPDELPTEKANLALAATGSIPEANWFTPSRPAGFFTVKGALEALFRRLGLNQVDFVPAARPFTHPTRAARVLVGGEEAGFLGELHPAIAERWDFPQAVTVAELDLSLLAAAADFVPRVAQLPRYPAARRDIAVISSGEIPAKRFEQAILEAGGGMVDRVALFDLYEGEQIPAGKRSLAFTITYRRPEGTLTDQEINAAQERIEKALSGMGAALRR